MTIIGDIDNGFAIGDDTRKRVKLRHCLTRIGYRLEGENTFRVFLIDDIAIIGCMVTHRNGEYLFGRKYFPIFQVGFDDIGTIPLIVKSVRCFELLQSAALDGFHFTVATFESEIGIAIVSSFFTIVGGKAYLDGLSLIGIQVDATHGPVFPAKATPLGVP